jgi:hypothetical protein
VLLALAAPASALSLAPLRGTLYTETEEGRVFDVGDLPVGVPTVVYVTLTADVADVTVHTVSVVPVGSAKAFYTLQEWRDLGGTVPDDAENAAAVLGPRKVVIDTATVGFEWPPVYFSPSEAWSRAEVHFSNTGRDDDAVQVIRAHAAVPAFAIFPPAVDFGQVQVGGVGLGEVRIRNEGVVPLIVSLGDVPEQVTSLEPEELVVGPGETHSYDLELHPLTDDPWSDTLSLVAGREAGASGLAVVNLRANDCEHGVASAYDRDVDGFTACAGDCDDAHASVHPGAVEIADGLDNDCDTLVDDHTPGYDDDGDGYCEHPTSCLDPAVLPLDCQDGDARIHPGADPLHGIDGDCDGRIDDDLLDADADGYAGEGGDCDDADAALHPGAPELANGRDDDCDGTVDEGTENADDDGDGFAEVDGDCDDTSDAASPDATDVPNGRDDDCDGAIDEGSPNADDDGDGLAEVQGDCDDGDPDVSPAARETADGRDDDCDGRADEDLDDVDHDGVTTAEGDCDDQQGWARPGAEEVYDGIDNDCDGDVDEGVVPVHATEEPSACGGCATGGLPSPAAGLLLALVGLRRRRR